MHEFIVGIGYAVLDFIANINMANIMSALSIMGIGMLGIFIVTGVIILVVTLLSKLITD